MKKFIISILLAAGLSACTSPKTKTATDVYTDKYYNGVGFHISALPDDGTALALTTYRPDTATFVIPNGGAQRIVAMSTTQIAYLELANQHQRLVGASSPEYISSPEVRKMSLPDVGSDGTFNYEMVTALRPDVVLLSSIGGKSSIANKLDELHIPYVYISDFEEQTPIARAEWGVAVGAIAGADVRENFRKIVQNYTPEPGNTPVMLNAPYGGSWFIPGRDGFMTRLLSDAGGKLQIAQKAGVNSTPVEMEQALAALSSAQVWLNPGMCSSLAELRRTLPKAKFDGPVWNQTNDFYESGAAQPDSVLAELKMIIRGSAPTDSLRYFYRLR